MLLTNYTGGPNGSNSISLDGCLLDHLSGDLFLERCSGCSNGGDVSFVLVLSEKDGTEYEAICVTNLPADLVHAAESGELIAFFDIESQTLLHLAANKPA